MSTETPLPFTFEQLIEKEDEYLEEQHPHPSQLKVDIGGGPDDGAHHDEPWVQFTNRDRLGLAFSGGGMRSASFNLGVLQTLASKEVLGHVDYLSTVSGGGYIGGFWSSLRRNDVLPEEFDGRVKQRDWVNMTGTERSALRLLVAEFPAALYALVTNVRVDASAATTKKVAFRCDTTAGDLPSLLGPANFKSDLEKPDLWKRDGLALTLGHGGFMATLPSPKESEPGGSLGVLRQARERGQPEPAEIRHVREFSRFLMPRVGFTKTETWDGIIAVLGGMLATLVATAACIAAASAAWVLLASMPGWWSLVPPAIVIVLTLVLTERTWLNWQRQDWRPGSAFNAASLTGFLVAMGASAWRTFDLMKQVTPQNPPPSWSTTLTKLVALDLPFHRDLLAPPAALAIAGLALLVIRMGLRDDGLTGFSRAAGWLFFSALVWAMTVLMWEGTRRLQGQAIAATTVGTISGGLFFWLREWLNEKPEDTRLNQGISAIGRWLRPLVPQVLAAVSAIALIGLGVGGFQSLLRHGDPCVVLLLLGSIGAVVALLFGSFFDPGQIGLQSFYRTRIARAFLGAAFTVGAPRPTVRQEEDDMDLAELDSLPGPVHLIGCTANDLQGDALQTLGRGGRSTTLSPFAIALGGFAREPGDITLGEALTASGAAFNSQMGNVSMQLGPAVAFVMSAFNLRLGLWVPHPLQSVARVGKFFSRPGFRLYYEALGLTRCDPVGATEARELNAELQKDSVNDKVIQKWSRDPSALHLSDGGHFENLGLYELVRRHCRYIIVSDAGADPETAFDDLGNAIRRIREDFSVEIDIDVERLRPVDGASQQHVSVGTIHYDGLTGSDKGTLLYIKPTIVGGEPPDVQQYRTRNTKFPHEGTADQFYDEAQWESYRRLGEYISAIALNVDDTGWKKKPNAIDALFLSLRQRWHAAPAQHTQTFLDFTERCSSLEAAIRESAPHWFRLELFPELQLISLNETVPAKKPERDQEKEVAAVLTWTMQLAQLMEDVWLAMHLDIYWSHPLNEGWMAYFHRWARTPSFRTWWPILRPLYSDGFRNFVKERFGLYVNDPVPREGESDRPGSKLRLCDNDDDWSSEVAKSMGLLAKRGPDALLYTLTLEQPAGTMLVQRKPIPVASLQFVTKGEVVCWSTADLVVPPWLVGSGVMARFLERVVFEFRTSARYEHVTTLRVTMPPSKRDLGRRTDHTNTIAFYKSRGFSYQDESTLELTIRPTASDPKVEAGATPRDAHLSLESTPLEP